jgi:hypothetical protein
VALASSLFGGAKATTSITYFIGIAEEGWE